MILSCQDLAKSYGTEEVLRDISFHLERGDKAALIGLNGAGKTTLLRILTGLETPDRGTVVLSPQLRCGYLAQYQDLEGDCTVYEEVRKARADLLTMEAQLRSMEAALADVPADEQAAFLKTYESLSHEFERRNGYASESEIQGVLRGLGFTGEDSSRKLSTLSGGQKTRVVLGRLLLEAPDILMLDEPTNHLDTASIQWLENRLQRYAGTLLIVSHDRYFMDRLVNKVIEIENGRSLLFTGNYSDFSRKKAAVREAQRRAWEKQQAEIRHQEDVIRRLRQFNREKSIKRAESREKQLSHIDLLDRPPEEASSMRLRLDPSFESGKDVCIAEGLRKSFDGPPLFSGLDLHIRRGERVALIGDNGTGKSTILKILGGLLEADAGTVRFGSRVAAGYYDQEQQLLHEDKTLFEEMSDAYPGRTETEIRNVLAAFLFTGDDVFKKISALSGGERARVTLSLLMLSGANFLLLDEPTNHLDIYSREILEEALRSYTGTVLYVSHDRYFVDRTATRTLELCDRRLTEYPGNYAYYLEKKAQLVSTQTQAAPSGLSAAVSSGGKEDWLARKEEQAKQRRQKQALQNCEDTIGSLEERIKEIDAELSLPETGTDLERCQTLSAERSACEQELQEQYERWEELATASSPAPPGQPG